MNKRIIPIVFLAVLFYGCSTTQKTTTTQPESSKSEPIDFSTLLEPPEDWHQLDEQQTQFRGISSELAYNTLLNKKSPKKEIIVAVIDGGVDINHEDLKNVIWTNENEIANNNRDDDQNGYIDDIHGWNFIGGADGKNVDHDTFELTRIYRRLHKKFSNIVDTTQLNSQEMEGYSRYKEISSEYEKKVRMLLTQYQNIESLEQSVAQAKAILTQHFGDSTYTYEEVQNLQPTDRQLNFAKNVMSYVMENDIDSTLIADQKKQIYNRAKYGYNPDFHTRQIVGDNYEDKTERIYGNNDVTGPDPFHGTHVSGIIAAERSNGIGIKGIATNTKIMAIRTVPDGDERDKDVANAIRYAVDNGADIINMSFGKGYSPDKKVVDAAIKYADEHGVLMVHGAGNEAQNTDITPDFPTDRYGKNLEGETASLWINVGANTWKPNEDFVANFSNYGDQTVDLFAPGVDIYSTVPGNEYKREDGTSMASPVVAGTAALIMAYYPNLTPEQVKKIILQSTIKYPQLRVIVPNEGDPNNKETKPFSELSASDGEVNVYKALEAAEKLSRRN
jgi:subtilisin family serine protease